MNSYVLGFLFSPDKRYVRLIEKKRPEWQAGKLNGIGGKIEDFDSCPQAAMRREFKEETGAEIDDWIPFAVMMGKDWCVYCYTTVGEYKTTSMTDEILWWKYVNILSGSGSSCCSPRSTPPLIDNLLWLIPLASEAVAPGNFGRPVASIKYE